MKWSNGNGHANCMPLCYVFVSYLHSFYFIYDMYLLFRWGNIIHFLREEKTFEYSLKKGTTLHVMKQLGHRHFNYFNSQNALYFVQFAHSLLTLERWINADNSKKVFKYSYDDDDDDAMYIYLITNVYWTNIVRNDTKTTENVTKLSHKLYLVHFVLLYRLIHFRFSL